jgi:hypothetical protein
VGTDVDETWDQSGDEDDESARINGILKVRGRFKLEGPFADLILKERTFEYSHVDYPGPDRAKPTCALTQVSLFSVFF